MGNWHCIPSSCAEVVYQPYESQKVRWRYGTEPWQEIIDADDYSSVSSYDLSANQRYRYVYHLPIYSNGIFQSWGQEFRATLPPEITQIQDWYVHFKKTRREGGITIFDYKTGSPPYDSFDNYVGLPFPPPGYRDIRATMWFLCQGFWITHVVPTTAGIWIKSIEPVNLSGATTQCQFKVFKKGQVVHQETRSVCPQVEKIPCSLSDVRRSVEVKKIPYLERVEVVPYAYSAYKLPGVGAPIVQADKIPDECLNVYYNNLYVIPPSGQGIYPDGTPFSSFVAQICSAPGCPPPEYEVTCDSCGCESCPGDTCPVECNGVICCYNDYGISVKEIAKSNYCGG